MSKKPLILVTNDDSISSKGIRALVRFMQGMGEILVVAPDQPQSGMGHAITIGNSLRLDQTDLLGESINAYTCSGTPVDCVKIAQHHILKNLPKPDLVVSGINHGSNTSINVLYSGTMSAAIEAAMEGVPSIGFSLCDYSATADFDHCEPWVKKISQMVLDGHVKKGTALNVNFPKKSAQEIQGVRFCRQAKANWRENFLHRKDPHGRDYYWLTGHFEYIETDNLHDEWAIAHNFVSVVPCQFDLTDYTSLESIRELQSL